MKPLGSLLPPTGSDPSPPTWTNSSASDAAEVCPICGGLGYVRVDLPVGHPDFGKLFRCPRNHGAVDEERLETLRKVGNLGVFADKSFENFTFDLPYLNGQQRASLRAAFEVAQAYARDPRGWLVLEGTYGCGKTHLAAAVANTRLNLDETVLLVTAPDLLDHLRTTYGPSSEVGYDEMFDRLRNVPMLVLDDLGVENPSQWAQEKLFQLLNYRYNRQLPTIITTNTDLDLLDARIRSRLLDESIIHRVRITAPDYRTPVQNKQDQLSSLALYLDRTFESYDPNTGVTQDEHANLVRAGQIAYDYASQPRGWLVFMSKYNASGKTHLAAAIANFRQEQGDEVVFVTTADLLDFLRMTFGPGSTVSFDRRFQSIRNAGLLVLDDLGTESASAWAREKLFQIIDYRYVAKLPTVITTSKAAEEIDGRIASRIADQRICTIIRITAPDFPTRLKRG
ncbi:MAG: ATP-binding protein [Anaerolineae bacterium]|nr:ATP-binding protein [Anaerolineae bacterium]